MNKCILFLVCLLALRGAGAQQSMNITLMAHWNDSTLNRCDDDQIWSDIMGWADTVKHREYAIVGSCDSIYFFDITDPTKLVKVDVEEGHSRNAINRDYETFSHYVYCVSDRTSPPGSLQIFDLQYLPDSVHKVYDDDTYSVNSHTLFIEEKSKRLYLCTNIHKPSGLSSMYILSIANPEVPVLLGELSSGSSCGRTHEVYVRNDTAWCSCEYSGLFVYDVRDAANPVKINALLPPYPYNGFNHSSWLDSSGHYVMFTDENQGLPIKIYDTRNLNAPVSIFNSNTGALPHNAYWKGRFAWASMYEDGVYAFDLANPAQPKIAGYYDTYMKNLPGQYHGFHGCWGVYPFLPSGYILASDISEGIFVLKASPTLGVSSPLSQAGNLLVQPNPFTEIFSLDMSGLHPQPVTITITDMQGKHVMEKDFTVTTASHELVIDDCATWSKGIFMVVIRANEGTWSSRIVKQ